MIDAVLNNDDFGQEGFVRGIANLSFNSISKMISDETVGGQQYENRSLALGNSP